VNRPLAGARSGMPPALTSAVRLPEHIRRHIGRSARLCAGPSGKMLLGSRDCL